MIIRQHGLRRNTRYKNSQLVAQHCFVATRGVGTSLQEATGDEPLDGVAFYDWIDYNGAQEGTPKKMGRGVRPTSQNPYPIYEKPAG